MDLEIKRGELTLLPIRIDNTVMDIDVEWAEDIRYRHIGDFTRWEQRDAYHKTFERLLRDLNSTEPPPLPPHLTAEKLKVRRIESLQTQLGQQYDNLHTLQEDATEYGAPFEVPLHLRNKISALENTIDTIEDELEGLRPD